MKLRIAESLIKENDPRLDQLFAKFHVISRQVADGVVEYEISGIQAADPVIVPHFDGKSFSLKKDAGGTDLSRKGILLKEIPAQTRTISVKLEAIKAASVPVPPPDAEPPAEPGTKEDRLEDDDQKFEVIKENKVKDPEGNLLPVGSIVGPDDVAGSLKRMVTWNWVVPVED